MADEDVPGTEAGFEELRAIRFAQVEENVLRRRLMAWWRHVEPLQGIRLVAGAQLVEPLGSLRELRMEFDGNFGADFVAAATDGWADGSEQVRRPGAKMHVHFADSFGDDALERAAPSGMDSGDSALFWIHKKNGNAVGRLHAKKQAGAVRGGSVAAAGRGRRGIEEVQDVRMNLFERDEL
jgi:hypothetical protein